MGASEWVFGSLLVLALLALSGYVGWRQVLMLRRLRHGPALPADEAIYEGRKAVRRLIGSGLTLVMGLLLATILVAWEGPVKELTDEREQYSGETAPDLTAAQKVLVRKWGWSVVALLVVLLALVALAGV